MAELDEEVAMFRGQTFALNTKKTYATHLKTYMTFCNQLKIPPVPVDEATVARYAAFLARTRKPATVRQYLNIVRLLHLECGLPNPMDNSWIVKSTVKGIERVKGCAVNRKQPISPAVLLRIKEQLRMTVANDQVFWAACLVLFFGLLRKSNVLCESARADPDKQLTRGSFIVDTDSSALTAQLHWSKTIQYKERSQTIRFPCLAPHPLCPVTAVIASFRATAPSDPKAPAFPMTAAQFNARLKRLAGQEYSSHSFRRGGATHALSCGIPGEVIKILGDWRSSAYMSYLDQVPQVVLDHYRNVFAAKLLEC